MLKNYSLLISLLKMEKNIYIKKNLLPQLYTNCWKVIFVFLSFFVALHTIFSIEHCNESSPSLQVWQFSKSLSSYFIFLFIFSWKIALKFFIIKKKNCLNKISPSLSFLFSTSTLLYNKKKKFCTNKLNKCIAN